MPRQEWRDFPNVIVNAPLAEATSHPHYQFAKNGCIESAIQLVQDVLTEHSLVALKELVNNKQPVLISVHALEDISINR